MQNPEQPVTEIIQSVLLKLSVNNATLHRLPLQGSNRIYYRAEDADKTYICTYSDHIAENESFIYFSNFFKSHHISVPEILMVNEEKTCYVQEDFGNLSLLAVLEKEGFSENVFNLYKHSLQQLVLMQVSALHDFDFDKCFASKVFDKEAIHNDLLYFKYYFLDVLQLPYDKALLLKDFDMLSAYLSGAQVQSFMYRDFQSRNILVSGDNKVHFIDFQGGMQGAPQYDVASLLWQAKANLPEDWKQKLWQSYLQEFQLKYDTAIDVLHFEERYKGFVLLRLLQVLGAYGFRGLFERKAHFLSSIPHGLKNLSAFMEADEHLLKNYPVLQNVLKLCTDDKLIEKFTIKKAGPESKLQIQINSFSYLQNGYPQDGTSNGGGFVFDCRGILNPGRIDEYKTQSGEDEGVQTYLEMNTSMQQFLQAVYNAVDISVENYLQRNFTDLSINFGCTGGQHRSVYAANATAKHLQNKYGIKSSVKHLNRDGWRKVL